VPTYQYACTESACGHQFEKVQSFSDTALTTCPICEGRLRKVFSPVGVVFKGSGFYRTDSRAANGSKNGAGKGENAKGGKDTAAAKSDSSAKSSEGGGSSENSGSSGSSSTKPTPGSAPGTTSTPKAAAT
jgi:putative FmdB family regulatory protein